MKQKYFFPLKVIFWPLWSLSVSQVVSASSPPPPLLWTHELLFQIQPVQRENGLCVHESFFFKSCGLQGKAFHVQLRVRNFESKLESLDNSDMVESHLNLLLASESSLHGRYCPQTPLMSGAKQEVQTWKDRKQVAQLFSTTPQKQSVCGGPHQARFNFKPSKHLLSIHYVPGLKLKSLTYSISLNPCDKQTHPNGLHPTSHSEVWI